MQKLADEKIADERARAEKAKDLELVDLGPQPEMIDDFIRNYFANMGLTKTLAQVCQDLSVSIRFQIRL